MPNPGHLEDIAGQIRRIAMTSRERLMRALGREKPDRLPVSVHQWQGYHLDTYLGGITDLEAFQRFLQDLWKQASDAVAAGKTLRETLAAVELQYDEGYEVFSIPFVMKLDRDFVVRRAWEEASRAVSPAAVPVSSP